MEEKAEDEAKKGDDKDERTKKPDEAKSGKDAERKKVQGPLFDKFRSPFHVGAVHMGLFTWGSITL